MFEGSLTEASREQQLEALRGKMAAITGRVGAATRSGLQSIEVIGVAGGLGELLPYGGLQRGSTVACPRGSVLAGILASVTGVGLRAAVIGGHQLGLLSVAEMGGDLSRLYIINPGSGDDIVTATSLLLEGLPVVVVDVDRYTIPAPRWRGVATKLRNHHSILITTEGVSGARPDLSIDARPCRYSGLRPGRGRIREIHLAVRVRARHHPPRAATLTLSPTDGRVHWVQDDSLLLSGEQAEAR